MMMSKRCIRMTVAYDGTDFSGWQRQAEQRSVQGEIESALATMHGHAVAVTAAGRTDAGVHAAGQVVHFHSDIASIPADKFKLALNKLMPRDVRIIDASEAQPGFHARFDARLRRYKYFIRFDCPPLPHLDRYAWRLAHRPDIRRLNRLSACLRGELDCTAFATAKDPHDNRFRYLHHAIFYMEGQSLVFDIAANAFLWHMVRSLTGTLVELDRKAAPDDALRRIIESKDRKYAGATAPANGLFLWQVEYYRQSELISTDTRGPAGLEPSSEPVLEPAPEFAPEQKGSACSRRLVPGLGYIA